MAQPEIEAIDDGFKYIMERAGDFTLEDAQQRAKLSEGNGYTIKVARAPRPRHQSCFEVTIKGNQAASLSKKARRNQRSGQLDPYNNTWRDITTRVEWVCGYWDELPLDTLGS